MTSRRCIIIGGGHAAAQLSVSLRKQGWSGDILVLAAEPLLPYQRPPLSKDYLKGVRPRDQLPIRQQAVYDSLAVRFRLGARATAIDAADRTVTLENGETLAYDRLALATGSSVRRLQVPGVELEGIHYLRTLADVDAILPGVATGKRAVIVGGGYIGLETAASLRALGMEVRIIEALPVILQRVTAPEVSDFFLRLHREQGVRISTGAGVRAFAGESRVSSVICDDGRQYPADLVVIGIGVVPQTDLAEAAGLVVDDGVVVDNQCRSSNPDIVAAGDCTAFTSERYGGLIHLESVQNAVEQATVAAATLCGIESSYTAIPWFWSDQYDVKLQIAGLSRGYDRIVIRGDRNRGRQFAVFYLKQKRLVAVDAVNSPQAYMIGKRLIAAAPALDPVALADTSVDLRTL